MAPPSGHSSNPTLYLDESGDLGFDFTKPGTSNHLTIAFITTTDPTGLKRAVRRVKQKHGIQGTDELKGYDTDFAIRKELIVWIRRLTVEVHAITAYKPNVKQALRDDTNILYNYIAGLILVPYVSAQTAVSVVYDARTIGVKSGFDIDHYLRYKVRFEEGKQTTIQTHHMNSKNSLAIQAADIVTHAIFRKYESGDARLANLIVPRVACDKRLFFP